MGKQLHSQDLARIFCQDEKNHQNIVYIENIDCFGIYQPDKNYFKLQTEDEFNQSMFKYLLSTDLAWQKNMTTAMVKDIAKMVKWMIYKKCTDINTNYIAMTDKVLNLDTFEYEDPSPDKMVFYFVDCKAEDVLQGYGDETSSLWIKFINQVIVDKQGKPDPETVKLVQEMMGYYLLNTMEGQISFFLNGKGQNGKSVFLNVLRYMIGKEFAAASTVEDLTTDKFAPASLIGKKVNICSEDESKFTRSDKFKTLISGDDITVQRKYGSHFSWRPTVRHIFSTNDMPTFSGLSFALIRRIKIVPFYWRIPESLKDTKLTEKLYKELPKIVAWALEGAKRLTENEFKFSQSALVEEKIEEFKDNLSGALLFFKERYVEEAGKFVADDELYENYKIWCESRGKKAQNFYNFIKDINDNLTLEPTTGWGDDQRMLNGRQIAYQKNILTLSL